VKKQYASLSFSIPVFCHGTVSVVAHVCNSNYNGTFLFTFFGSCYLQTELALQLCWAVGEHGGGGLAHKAAARELFETLELLLYENLSSRSLFFLSPIFTSDSWIDQQYTCRLSLGLHESPQ
jgi:hypothetical protein